MHGSITKEDILHYRIYLSGQELARFPRHLMQNFIKSLEDGDTEALITQFYELPMEQLYVNLSDPNKKREYALIHAIVLMCHISIDIGVSYEDAFDLYTLYMQKTSEIKTASEYKTLHLEAIKSYADLIRKTKRGSNESIYLKKCKQYVIDHLCTKISLTDAAEYVDISPSYLSALFSQNEKMTFSEYVNRTRIDASKDLLEKTDYSICEIAFYFNFSSQSHYCYLFHRFVGITPTKYRKIVRYMEEE